LPDAEKSLKGASNNRDLINKELDALDGYYKKFLRDKDDYTNRYRKITDILEKKQLENTISMLRKLTDEAIWEKPDEIRNVVLRILDLDMLDSLSVDILIVEGLYNTVAVVLYHMNNFLDFFINIEKTHIENLAILKAEIEQEQRFKELFKELKEEGKELKESE